MKILLIDDSKSICEMLSKFLAFKGHECMISNDGKEGLMLIEGQTFDCILLDITMPKISGMEIVDYLHKRGNMGGKKIIVLTASAIEDAQIESLLEKGVHSCLLKPVSLDVLLAKIESK